MGMGVGTYVGTYVGHGKLYLTHGLLMHYARYIDQFMCMYLLSRGGFLDGRLVGRGLVFVGDDGRWELLGVGMERIEFSVT